MDFVVKYVYIQVKIFFSYLLKCQLEIKTSEMGLGFFGPLGILGAGKVFRLFPSGLFGLAQGIRVNYISSCLLKYQLIILVQRE